MTPFQGSFSDSYVNGLQESFLYKFSLKMTESEDYSGYDPAKSAVNSLEINFLFLYFSSV